MRVCVYVCVCLSVCIVCAVICHQSVYRHTAYIICNIYATGPYELRLTLEKNFPDLGRILFSLLMSVSGYLLISRVLLYTSTRGMYTIHHTLSYYITSLYTRTYCTLT